MAYCKSRIKENTIETICPTCNYKMDRAAGLTGLEIPEEGCSGICFNCGEILVFNKDLSLRLPTAEELDEASKIEKLVMAQKWIKARGYLKD
jgi:RNase P subunit RPR2